MGQVFLGPATFRPIEYRKLKPQLVIAQKNLRRQFQIFDHQQELTS